MFETVHSSSGDRQIDCLHVTLPATEDSEPTMSSDCLLVAYVPAMVFQSVLFLVCLGNKDVLSLQFLSGRVAAAEAAAHAHEIRMGGAQAA